MMVLDIPFASFLTDLVWVNGTASDVTRMQCAASFASGQPTEMVTFACGHFMDDANGNSHFDSDFAWWLQPSIDTQIVSDYPGDAFIDLYFLPRLFVGAKARLVSHTGTSLSSSSSCSLIVH